MFGRELQQHHIRFLKGTKGAVGLHLRIAQKPVDWLVSLFEMGIIHNVLFPLPRDGVKSKVQYLSLKLYGFKFVSVPKKHNRNLK